jgi:predicted phage terminase large subunit-like protein
MPELLEGVTREQLKAELAGRHLRHFVEQAWPIVEPVQKFIPNWHIDKLCDTLERVTRGEIRRLIVNMPPGTSKSLIVSVFWPAWEWATQSHLRYLTASYSDDLTIRDNMRMRDIVTSPWFQEYFPLALRSDQNAKTRMDTTTGGWRIATSVGGKGTGYHPDRIIIDDPINPKEALSDASRETANTWYDATISNRGLARGARIVLIMQRLHIDDLAGHLIKRGGFHLVRWPMRYDAKIATDDDERTEHGALLWPALFNEEMVAAQEIVYGGYNTAGQYQQWPIPLGGTMVQRDWFKFYKELPFQPTDWLQSWDCNFKNTEDNDFVCGGVWCRKGQNKYLVHRLNKQLSFPGTLDAIRKMTEDYPQATLKLIEEAANGYAVIQSLQDEIDGIVPVKPMGSKAARLAAASPTIESGHCFLPDPSIAPWVEDFLTEVTSFPRHPHDDQVDMMSQALNRYRNVDSVADEKVLTAQMDDGDETGLPAQF